MIGHPYRAIFKQCIVHNVPGSKKQPSPERLLVNERRGKEKDDGAKE